jgi:hypothetical protein
MRDCCIGLEQHGMAAFKLTEHWALRSERRPGDMLFAGRMKKEFALKRRIREMLRLKWEKNAAIGAETMLARRHGVEINVSIAQGL